jgi:hypothetical protein
LLISSPILSGEECPPLEGMSLDAGGGTGRRPPPPAGRAGRRRSGGSSCRGRNLRSVRATDPGLGETLVEPGQRCPRLLFGPEEPEPETVPYHPVDLDIGQVQRQTGQLRHRLAHLRVDRLAARLQVEHIVARALGPARPRRDRRACPGVGHGIRRGRNPSRRPSGVGDGRRGRRAHGPVRDIHPDIDGEQIPRLRQPILEGDLESDAQHRVADAERFVLDLAQTGHSARRRAIQLAGHAVAEPHASTALEGPKPYFEHPPLLDHSVGHRTHGAAELNAHRGLGAGARYLHVFHESVGRPRR